MRYDLVRDYHDLSSRIEQIRDELSGLLAEHDSHNDKASPLTCSPMWAEIAMALTMVKSAEQSLLEHRTQMLGTSTLENGKHKRRNTRAQTDSSLS